MVTFVTLCVVVVAALAGGFLVAKRAAWVALVGAVGLTAMIGAFAVFVVTPNPGGDGSSDRYEVYGHWVPIWQCNLMEASAFAWLIALLAGSWVGRHRPAAAMLGRL